MQTATDLRPAIDTLCHRIATETFRRYSRDLTPLYLFGEKDGGIYRRLRLDHTKPRYFEMVVLTMLPRNLETGQLAQWLKPWLNSSPIIQEDDTLATLQ